MIFIASKKAYFFIDMLGDVWHTIIEIKLLLLKVNIFNLFHWLHQKSYLETSKGLFGEKTRKYNF